MPPCRQHRQRSRPGVTPGRRDEQTSCGGSATSGAGVGNLAPAISGTALDGSTVSLAGFKGHPVVVNFWASWCPPCKDSFPALDVIQRDYRARGVVVIVSVTLPISSPA